MHVSCKRISLSTIIYRKIFLMQTIHRLNHMWTAYNYRVWFRISIFLQIWTRKYVYLWNLTCTWSDTIRPCQNIHRNAPGGVKFKISRITRGSMIPWYGIFGVSYVCGRPYCAICMCSFIVVFCCLVIWQFLIAARLWLISLIILRLYLSVKRDFAKF
jgi:hypothetical protein